MKNYGLDILILHLRMEFQLIVILFFHFPENEMLHHQLEDLVDIAIYECEKYYPAFQLVLFEDTQPTKALEISTFETIGQA